MGIVAGQALPSLEGVVAGAASRCQLFHQVSVAIGAKGGAGFPQELLLIRSVPGVARGAVPGQNGIVNIFLVEIRFRIGVAAVTDFIRPTFQDRRAIGSMGVMTGGAVPL